MSLYRDYQFRELSTFGGAWLLDDRSTIDVRGAIRAQNVEYVLGGVQARLGYKDTARGGGLVPFNGTTNLVELYCWYAPFSTISSGYSNSLLVGLDAFAANNLALYGKVIAGTGGFSTTTAGLASTPAGGTFVGVGMRLYSCYFDSAQNAITVGGVNTAYSNAGALAIVGGTNNLLLGPCTYTPTTSEPGAGVVTAGSHRLGYLLEYSNGFTTRVSPDTGTATPSISTFTPIAVTASGSKNLRVSFANGWGAEVVAVSLVMTTTYNLNQYYIVPGSRTTAANPMTITIDISDADLASQGLDATPYLYWLTQWATSSGVATVTAHQPFQTRHIALLSDRMGYLATSSDNKSNAVDALFVSERNNYQALTADQHILQLPGQRPMTTMFRMGSSNYILGPHEVWSAQDNGDVPATWAAPTLIDGRHGTLAIHGVEVAPSGQYAWIADQSGLYLFNGTPITGRPVSYQQTPHWGRINWSAACCVKIKDDATNQRVYVMVPLDSATTPSHLMVFDYTDGASWESVRYSLDNLSGYSLGCMDLVRNDLSGAAAGTGQRIELWVGSSAVSSPVLRRASTGDATPYRDNGAAINSIYRTAPLPGRDQAGGVISMHHGFHARLTGSGTITPVMYDIDSVRSFTCRTATLSTTPDADLLFAADLRGELAAVEFNTNTLDTSWVLAYLRYYHSPYIMQR